MRVILFCLTLSLAARAPGEELLLVASAGWNAGASIELGTLRRLYLGRRTRMEGRIVRCLAMPPGSVARERFNDRVLGMGEDELAAYWIEQALQGGAIPPEEVEDAPELAREMAASGLSLGYVLHDGRPGDLPAGLRILRVTDRGQLVLPGEIPDPPSPSAP